MLDVGAVAAKAGPPVAAEEEAAALVPAIEGCSAAGRAVADLRRHLLGRGRARRRSRPGATAVNDISGGSDEMFELVAERGCGYVLMHIEGPPRVDRERARLRRRRRPPEGLVRGASRAGRSSSGSPRSRSRSTPGSTSTSSTEQDLEILRRLGRAEGARARRSTSRSRARTSSAPSSPAPGRSGWPAGEREWGTVAATALAVRAGADVLRIHDRSSLQAVQGRGRRSGRTPPDGEVRCSRPAWAIAIDPARRDGRIVAESAEEERPASPVAAAGRARPGLRRGARAAPGSSASTRTSCEAYEAAAESNLVITSGTASGKSLAFNLPVLDGIAADPKRRALYLYPTKALAQDQARKLARAAAAEPARRRSTTATPRARSGRRSAAAATSSSPTRTCSTSASSPTTRAGATSSPTSAGSSSTRPTPTAASSAPTSPTCCAGCGGSPAPTASEPRFLLASATIANPGELAERLVGEPFELVDDDGAPRAGRRDRDVEPAADRQGDRGAALAALRGGRAARRARLARGCGRSASSRAGAGSS